MVDPDSDRVSRAPPYLGFRYLITTISTTGLSPSSAGLPRPFFYNGYKALAVLQPRLVRRFRLFRFRSPLLSESLLISFPGVLRWFSSPSSASAAYFVQRRITGSLPLGYPIRLSADQWIFAPPRRFSQLVTAFFALLRQGIRRKPFFLLTILLFPGITLRVIPPGFVNASRFHKHRGFSSVFTDGFSFRNTRK